MPNSRAERVKALAEALFQLSDSQLTWTEGVIRQFSLKPLLWRHPASDIVNDCVLESFGDALQIHHCFSTEALSKDRFEYALESVLNRCGIPAEKHPNKCNPGHDLTIRGTPVSLKTQADKSLKANYLHISKFMELGKGAWLTEADLAGLRQRFVDHMKGYDRIFQLRRLTNKETLQVYELVEISKPLLLEAANFPCAMMNDSTQLPRPGVCRVYDKAGSLRFELYFDGGTERKLQIRHLDKSLCRVHATWGITRIPLSTAPVLE